MTTTTAQVSALVARYARRFHADLTAHHVASPLGAWLLLALCGTAATGPTRDELTEALGTDPEEAARVAADLLGAPHALVLSAAALWCRSMGADGARWLATLPREVTTGDLPGQAEADAWARDHTLGLIDRFPLRLTPDTLVVLATALATKVSWHVPFDTAPALELGKDSPWAGTLGTALRTPDTRFGHHQFVAPVAGCGDVVVHAADAAVDDGTGGQDGLVVVSVAAAPDVPAADVLAAAHRIGTAHATHHKVERRSLYDLPPGDGPLWTITERHARTKAPDGREERCAAVLPAWSASSEHDLRRPELGVPAAARALADLLGVDGQGYDAKQSAVARYTRVGFEAAAVTAMAVPLGYVEPRDGVVREATLRFGHPYAVVAVATQRGGGPWHGLPVFSAWVADPDDATA
jgi:hypothetical protein